LEAVIVIPVLMLLLLVLVQFALWAHAAQVAQLAASGGDRAARTMGGSVALGTAQAQSILGAPGSDVSKSSVVVTVLPGDLAEVRVSAHAESILPGLSLPVSATQVGPIQEFRAAE
jgi:Flp pilus assembly protein TadG